MFPPTIIGCFSPNEPAAHPAAKSMIDVQSPNRLPPTTASTSNVYGAAICGAAFNDAPNAPSYRVAETTLG
jgi:hypothetical protein